MDAANLAKVKGQMHSFAMGEAMAQAAQDYQQHILASQQAAAGKGLPAFYADDMLNDPEVESLQAERLEELKMQVERRAAKTAQTSYGSLVEIAEPEFLAAVMKAEHALCHFFHAGFQRCASMDRHLAILAPRFPGTSFLRLSAPDAPFFTEKLKIRTLPCVIVFHRGVAVDRIVGFEGIRGAGADFKTAALEERLQESGVLVGVNPCSDSEAEAEAVDRRTVRHGVSMGLHKSASDEDSDFSD
ncbi:hypothetical protein ACKKBG_A15555 [Auxenochlorella protothecoides x Auxenochlorella symbiontica]